MFQKQMQRFFPMPDYNLAEADRVQVSIPGHIVDQQYTQLLMERSDLDRWEVILLDRVQKRLRISADAHRLLKSAGLVEGRYPNLIIAARVASLTGQKARHIRERGFDKQYYLDAIEALVRAHQPIPRSEIDRLLIDKLPEILSEVQKRTKIHNLVAELARKGKIENRASEGGQGGLSLY